ncbi:MAG: helix-turn-helix transcriptional regulator [Eubacterium sp.]|nr:helix-turn-helix transcriptional regulator [Eubacterium sp.]
MKKDDTIIVCDEKTFEIIGTRLRNIREERHVTQSVFAERGSISIGYLSGIENGRKNPSLGTLYNICINNDISVDELFYGKKEKKPLKDIIKNEAVNLSVKDLKRIQEYISGIISIHNMDDNL